MKLLGLDLILQKQKLKEQEQMIQNEAFKHMDCKAAPSNAHIGGCCVDGNAAVPQLPSVTRPVVVAVKYVPWQPCATSMQVSPFLLVTAVVIME